MVLVRGEKALTSTPIQPEQETLVNKIRLSYSNDLEFPKDKYEFLHGILYSKGKIVIPNDTSLRNHIIQEFHDSVFSGHLGREKTLKNITSTMSSGLALDQNTAHGNKNQTCKMHLMHLHRIGSTIDSCKKHTPEYPRGMQGSSVLVPVSTFSCFNMGALAG